MIRKLSIIIFCFLISACSPKDAEVESKPFEEPTTDSFETLSLQEPLELNRASWFFWKKSEDMPAAMRLGAGLEMIGKNIAGLNQQKAALVFKRESYLFESLGPDNKQIWEDLYAKHLVNHEKKLATFIQLDAERFKPDEERDDNLIVELEKEFEALKIESEGINKQILAVEEQSHVVNFRYTIRDILEQIVGVEYKLEQLQQTAQVYQQQLSQLVELIPAPPKLLLQETENGLKIQLVDYQKDGIECSTDTGLIRSVIYKKQSGYIEFTAICKQPEWATDSQLVSYKIILEKIPTSATMQLNGNMGRCVDILPNVGKCEAGLATGVIKYQP
jgi:hypothetical protein